MHTNDPQDRIAGLEEQLRRAMLASDISALDKLISPELVFTTHLGQVIGKTEDLDMHRSGQLKFQAIVPSERRIVGDRRLAVVSLRLNLSGTFGEAPFALDLRCTRVWRVLGENDAWQLIAGHFSVL